MSKITIEIPKKNYEVLKQQAKAEYRSLTNYLTVKLIELAEGHQFFNTPALLDLSTLPPNTVVRTKTPPPPKTEEEIENENKEKFQKLAEQIVGHRIDEFDRATGDYNLCVAPGSRYYEYARPVKEGNSTRWAFMMPEYKQIEFLNEWREWER